MNHRRLIIQEQLKAASQRIKRSLNSISQIINTQSGYTSVQQSKAKVTDNELVYEQALALWKRSKTEFKNLNDSRTRCQRDVNNLLQRQQSWGKEDVGRFTELFTREHELERMVVESGERLHGAEESMERAHVSLMSAIRQRYNDEQVWADYVKLISTYGTFALVALNISMFVSYHGLIEPLRRQKMISGVAETVSDLYVDKTKVLISDAISRISLPEISSPPQIITTEKIVYMPSEPAHPETHVDDVESNQLLTNVDFNSLISAFVGAAAGASLAALFILSRFRGDS
jgi:hypothetical protein